MKHQPLIAVFGATGARGGGLVRAILDDPDRRFAARAIRPGRYRGADFPAAEDLDNLFQFNRDFERESCAARDPVLSRELNPRLQTFAQRLDGHARRIPLDS